MKKIYLLFCIIGTILPYYFLIQFLSANGLNLNLLVDLLFANSISTFFAVDFLIACVVFLVFMFREAKKINIKKLHWICVLTLFTVGLSLSFPLFLYFRESYLENETVAMKQ